MDEIAKLQREHVAESAEEQEEAIVDLDAAQAQLDAEDAEEEAEPDTTAAADAAAENEEIVPDPPVADVEYDELTIDGVKTKVEKSKVYDMGKRSMQKEISADAKLAAAAARQRELDQRESEIRLEEDKLKEILATGPHDDLSFDEAELKSIVDAIKYGDDDKTAEGLKQLVKVVRGAKATKGATLTAEEVKATVQSELERGKFESALESFKKPQSEGGYGELFDGGMIEQALRFEDGRLAKDPDGSKLPHLDRMKKAGDNVRAKFQSPTTSSPNNGSANQQRKAELGDTVTAAGGATIVKQAGKPKTELQRHTESLEAVNKQRKGR